MEFVCWPHHVIQDTWGCFSCSNWLESCANIRGCLWPQLHGLSQLLPELRGVAYAGKVLGKCGKCLRYMKLISIRPMRLYCPTCEEVLNLPQVKVQFQLN